LLSSGLFCEVVEEVVGVEVVGVDEVVVEVVVGGFGAVCCGCA
jgi:hypothetical protein